MSAPGRIVNSDTSEELYELMRQCGVLKPTGEHGGIVLSTLFDNVAEVPIRRTYVGRTIECRRTEQIMAFFQTHTALLHGEKRGINWSPVAGSPNWLRNSEAMTKIE